MGNCSKNTLLERAFFMRVSCILWCIIIFPIFLGFEVAYCQCLEEEKFNLLQLKESLSFNSVTSSKIAYWNSSEDCCSWPAVSCSNGHVIALDLSSEQLSGSLYGSSTLFNLKYLESLNLAFNQFSLTIPSNVGRLVSLVSLNLSNSGFTGQIPIELSCLTKLVTLDISSFHLLGDPSLKLENPNLTMIIRNLNELKELYLDGANISANGQELSQSLSSWLPNLEVMSMSNCAITGPLHHSLLKLQSLSVINLSKNNLLTPFPAFASNFLKLTFVSFSNCGLYGNVWENIFKVTSLQTLDLSSNAFLQGSLPAFPLNSSLQSVILSNTQVTGQIPDSVGSLQMLSKLDLSGCNFEGVLPRSIANLTQLVYLDLSNNWFTGPIPSFQGLKNLNKLKLSHNNFFGPVPSNCFEGLTNLVGIYIRNNSLNGTLPHSLFTIPRLQEMDLAFNRFSGQLNEFPSPLSSPLQSIDLERNNLEGPIPTSFFDLPNLNVLSLPFNKFSGIVYLHDIQKLHKLTSLVLSHSNLTIDVRSSYSTFLSFPPMISKLKLASCNLGVFPDLRNQSELAYLDLSDNLIEGKVPTWMWNIMGSNSFVHLNLSLNRLVDFEQPSPKGFSTLMTVLDLHSNNFQGQIPLLPQFASYMDYSNNNFTSHIPDDIGDFLISANFYSISGNRFTGNIPKSICNGTYLKVLDLSNNSLNGTIPPCLGKTSPNLMVLNVGKNNLRGFIPDTFPANCQLRTLDLSGNALEGSLPRTLANCNMLEVLNVGNNQIHDQFPCWLNHYSSLRVLVLRYNKFFGSIDCPDFKNTWINLQILDLASNNFGSILPSRYFSNWTAMMVNERESHSMLDRLEHRVYMLSDLYYQDRVILTYKNLKIELVKILTIFTFLDFSNNRFEGQIPRELGNLIALLALNMSHNALIGEIPSSIGNLKQLESLDLSCNKVNGTIPLQLASLTFLSILNLSFNQLEGAIPGGNQFGTFTEASFRGNEALCGYPLNKSCTEAMVAGLSPPSTTTTTTDKDSICIGAEAGFFFGFGIVVGLPVFWKKWRRWYYEKVIDQILFRIFPWLRYGRNYERKPYRKQRKLWWGRGAKVL